MTQDGMPLIKIRLPRDWCEAIEKERGSMTVATFIREALKEKLSNHELSIPTRRGRPAKEPASEQ